MAEAATAPNIVAQEIPVLPLERFAQLEAERLFRRVGGTALEHSIALEPLGETSEQIGSLNDAIHQAAWGNQAARQMVRENVRTDVVERTIKAGHVLKTRMTVNRQGQLLQHGQTMDGIQSNSLQFASELEIIRDRAEAETRNHFRMQRLRRLGELDTKYMVVCSQYAHELSDQEAQDVGFFTDTKSMAIQITKSTAEGVETEVAFVAGVAAPGAEAHDTSAIQQLFAAAGVDITNKSAADIIDTPLLIDQDQLPNGVIDLVALFDQHAGTFFGEAKPPQNYHEFLKRCQQREVELAPEVERIVNQLIDEADQIHSPLAATERLDELSQAYLLARAQTDEKIDPRVFGTVAAEHIEDARRYLSLGDTTAAKRAMSRAEATAASYSCPKALRQKSLEDVETDPDQLDELLDNDENQESLNGSIRCIKCRKYVKKAEVVKKDRWCCPKCRYAVDVCNGQILDEGIQAKPTETAQTDHFQLLWQTVSKTPVEESTIDSKALVA